MKKTQRYLLLLLVCIFLVFYLLFQKGKTEAGEPLINNEIVKNNLGYPKEIAHNLNEMESINQVTEIDKSLLLGKVNASTSPLFVRVSPQHANRDNIYLLAEVYEAFKEMYRAAQNDGIRLIIWSGFRDFDHQKRIWNNKWNGVQMLEGNIRATEISDEVERITEILKFSAMPGTSRHHWGTDIDLNSLSNSYFRSGQGLKIYNWLLGNAANFGFHQPYTEFGENRSYGHMEEKWHWTYLPVSKKYLDSYLRTVNLEDLKGFEGDFLAKEVDVIKNYVMGIHREILDRSITPR